MVTKYKCLEPIPVSVVTTSDMWLFKFKSHKNFKFSSSVPLAPFQMLSNHTWLDTSVLHSSEFRTLPVREISIGQRWSRGSKKESNFFLYKRIIGLDKLFSLFLNSGFIMGLKAPFLFFPEPSNLSKSHSGY